MDSALPSVDASPLNILQPSNLIILCVLFSYFGVFCNTNFIVCSSERQGFIYLGS